MSMKKLGLFAAAAMAFASTAELPQNRKVEINGNFNQVRDYRPNRRKPRKPGCHLTNKRKKQNRKTK